jgi:acyl carrier protein
MKLDEFINNFAEQFDDTEIEEFRPDVEFKALDEWSSLTSLQIIAMVDDEYNIVIESEDIRDTETIQELFDLINDRSLNP